MSEENLQAAAEQAVSYDRMLSIIDGALQRTSAWSAHDRALDLLGGRQLDFVYAPGVVFPKEVHPDLYPVKRQKCEEIRTSCPDDDPPHWRHVMY
ncbi:hypothetical protein K466DRAFT_590909 [Polyporus arcularius HHB13444]|uniref:Uncharacterized protein n=1 Tax=Polyporus arcularius HHB13444 TaxID=1314778 RepID=A0A5C3NZZ8_9APHY|nr:hypothetical protein K466DRAFT_590909 [Polyporus arcularius HHB13444]